MARIIFRFASRVVPLLLPFTLGSALATAAGVESALPVSPGDWQAGTPIADTCPSFSWGAVAGAQSYELAIFDAQWQDSPAYDDQLGQGQPLRHIDIAAPALSWTPAGADCLDAGGTYLWFVRAQTAEGEGPWSAPRFFEIDYDSDALTQTVRRELAAQLRQPEVWREVIQAALSSNANLRLTSLAPGVVVPTSRGEGTAADGAGRDRLGASAEQGIGVLATYPAALKINSPNGVVFNQSATGGGIPAEGSGTRFMWYPGKAALRAGYVGGTQWDNTNIGVYSVAMGLSANASGYAATALGFATGASGDYSTAMGYNTTASGDRSTAMGVVTAASGDYSTAMGYGTTASGYNSTAMGVETAAQSYAETAIGRWNTVPQPYDPDEWVLTDRLFVIGNGTGSSSRSDAMVVLKNGRTGIGHSTPKARLNVLTEGQYNWDVGSGWGDFSIDNGTYGLAFGVATGGAGAGDAYVWAKGGAQGIYFGNPTDGILLQVGDGKVKSYKPLEIQTLGAAGATALCRNAANQLASCSSSSRYKEDILPLSRGLATVEQLRPVTFHWKDGQGKDLGFLAEEMAVVEPLLVTHNDGGEIEGVKYSQLTAVVVKAIQEQEEHIQLQQKLIGDLHADNAALEHRLSDQEQNNGTLVQRLADQEQHNATLVQLLMEQESRYVALMQRLGEQEQRLVSLEAENARLGRLQADLAQLQAQMRVLQGQRVGAVSRGQVALGR